MNQLLKLTLLGMPTVTLANQSLTYVLSNKALALFIYLAVTQCPHSRDRLATLLWSEFTKQQSRNNLRDTLSDLRRVVGDYLCITPQTISFNQQASFWYDVSVLRTTLTTPSTTVSLSGLQAALDLYVGEFLHGFNVRNAPLFEEWVTSQRSELHTIVIQGLYQLAESYEQKEQLYAGLATTQRLLTLEPWHEGAHRLRMRLLTHSGQRGAALAQFVTCQQALSTELGVPPERETVALYQQIRSGAYQKKNGKAVERRSGYTGIAASLSPLLSVNQLADGTDQHRYEHMAEHRPVSPMPKHNLPSQLTSFIGREQTIADLHMTLVAPERRLITLVGEGGIGKTRLALAVAQSILDSQALSSNHQPSNSKSLSSKDLNFPDGIWFVSLSGMTKSGNLTNSLAVAVAQAIRWQFSDSSVLPQLLAYLHDKALLLLFDNAEHLLPEVADFLIQLLQSSPQSTILVTSRHILNLQTEFVWRVIGLQTPPSKELTADALLAYSSGRLFVERATYQNRNFQLNAANLTAIAAICQLMEGLPLAIELAAALTKQYSCPDLYVALQRDYTMLAATFADLSPRHRSIQTMLDYSWRFLSPEEGRTLAACAIFWDGFTLAAAVAVASTTPAVLNRLVDQSLLQIHESRFTIHELVRQYAAAQLARSPEEHQATANLHAAYYINLLHNLAGPLLVTVDAQRAIQNELGNVRAAWHWSAAQADLELLDKGSEGLQSFYYLTGLYREGIHSLETALAAVSQSVSSPSNTPAQPQALRVRLLCYTTQFYRRSGEWEKSKRLASEALSLGCGLANPALQGQAYHELARLAYVRGDFSHMYELAQQGYKQVCQTDLPHLIAESLNDLGLAVSMCQGPLAAITHFHEALQVLQRVTNRVLEAFIFVNLGFFYLSCHEYQQSCDHLQQGIALQHLLQIRGGSIMPQIYLGDLWMALGLYDQAQQQYEQVFALVQTIHSPYSKSYLYTSYGRLQHLCGDPTAAVAACRHARELAQQSGLEVQEQWALVALGHALMDLEDFEGARHSYQQAIALHKPGNWVYRTADAHAGLAALCLAHHEVAAAVEHSEAALAILAQQGLSAAREPFGIYWTCICAFSANNDPRTTEILRTGNQILQATAAKFEEESWRHAFLQQVIVNRQLVAAGAATTGVLEKATGASVSPNRGTLT